MWGGCDFDDARRHPSREPRDVIDSLEAALTFDLRLELVHLRFYRVSQFCNSQSGNCVTRVPRVSVFFFLFYSSDRSRSLRIKTPGLIRERTELYATRVIIRSCLVKGGSATNIGPVHLSHDTH